MNQTSVLRGALATMCLVAAIFCVQAARAATTGQAGKTRTYYIAADEVQWDYAPSGRDEAMGMPFDAIAKGFAETGPNHIGRVYKKAIYREYTDATFTDAQAAPDPGRSTSAWLAPSFTPKSVTPSRSSSRTTPRIPTACIRTASSIRRTPKAQTTTTAPAARIRKTAASRPAPRILIPGRFPNALAPVPTTPARSSGSITRIATSCAMWPQAFSADLSSPAAAWRGPTALPKMSTKNSSPCLSPSTKTRAGILTTTSRPTSPIPQNSTGTNSDPSRQPGSSVPSPVQALLTPTSNGPSTATSTATCPSW